MFEEKVRELLNNALVENPSLFLINFDIDANFAINIVLDGDHGVTVEDCISVSRAIEHNLDREVQDFSLEVASCGAAAPLTCKRQYKKNLNRTLEVLLMSDKKIEGKLTEVTDDFVVLAWKSREPKPVGKGKVTVNKIEQIAFSDIRKASVMITFN